MVLLKTKEEIEILREGGKRHAEILRLLSLEIKAGMSTFALDKKANDLIKEGGDLPAFLGYVPSGVQRPFPASICISINDEIVHGIPGENDTVFKEGDVVAIDLGLTHKGMITDSAISVVVGKGKPIAYELIEATKTALYEGIEAARTAKNIGDITSAIESYVKSTPFSLAKDLAGHGVGYKVHEDPFVPNFGKKSKEKIVPGLVIAIEPMLVEGKGDVVFDENEYTVRTKDGSLSAHFEHTVAFTDDGIIVLTEL